MLRYRINPTERIVLLENPDFTGRRVEILPMPAPIFVDILGENQTSYHLRVFMPNGDVVVGWCLGKILGGLIQIHDSHLLFDGRFNSDRLPGRNDT